MSRQTMLIVCFSVLFIQSSFAQPQISKIEPPNWWVGMKWNSLQLMIYGKNLTTTSVSTENQNVKITSVKWSENGSYLFIDLDLSNLTTAGNLTLELSNPNGKSNVTYPILKRESPSGKYRGFQSQDVIYLITPDRFADGNEKNNNLPNTSEAVNRSNPYGRHGGDIEGILRHLDYFSDLGITALWINPLLENNGATSYHGYALTDHYQIDSRFGTNDLYKKLVLESHKRGIKIIMDHVNNHIGKNHPWIADLPTSDWLNGSMQNHLRATHTKETLTDVYAEPNIRDLEVKGWFSDYMPDLNQSNPFVANYLVQNTIWWIETTGMDGIREDTYPYTYPEFSKKWNNAIMSEYPAFNIVGEVWIQNPVYLAPYQKGQFFPTIFDSELPSVTDFGLFQAFMDVISQGKIYPLYECLTKDFLYPNPNNLVTFLDNHDIVRINKVLGDDPERLKFFLQLLMVTRGIPQLYYGTEIGMVGGTDHGRLRMDFPGGFPGDKRNAFSKSERTETENEIYEFTKQMINLRKNNSAFYNGKMTHLPPKNELYVFYKQDEKQTIVCIANNKSGNQLINLNTQTAVWKDVKRLRDLQNGRVFEFVPNIELEIPGWTVSTFELIK